MPTFTAISLDTLIEPGGALKSSSDTVNGSNPVQNSQLRRRNSTPAVAATTTQTKYHWTQISPSLYATPEVTPLPDTPCSFPTSPYIINHKRRGPPLLKSLSEVEVSSFKKPRDQEKFDETLAKLVSLTENGDVALNDVSALKLVEAKHVNGVIGEEAGRSGVEIGVEKENKSARCVSSHSDEESDVFYDQQGSSSFRSDTDGEDNGGTDHSFKLSTSTVFYDAWEELSSDGTSQSSVVRDVDDEIREMRLSLLMEMEKRKQAEETLANISSQWQRIREQLSLAGLALPTYLTVQAGELMDSYVVEDLCRQLYLARFVADSVGRGIAKAEVEVEMESQIEVKNVEIARLTDRLHYYEAVNREMSQRNQEGVEMARRDRQRRKNRQRWVWGSVAAAITFGAAALTWSVNQSGTRPLPPSNHSEDSGHHESAK